MKVSLNIEKAGKIGNKLNIEPKFLLTATVCSRKKPRLFEYKQCDEDLVDPKINFKVEFYYKILTLSSLNSRFKDLKIFDDVPGI